MDTKGYKHEVMFGFDHLLAEPLQRKRVGIAKGKIIRLLFC